MSDLDAYLAWREGWISKHGTLDSAIERAREQGGEEYAAKIGRFIAEMEEHLSSID